MAQAYSRALERAQKKVEAGRVALVSIRTDWRARTQVQQLSQYLT
jgi:hypothetical protein